MSSKTAHCALSSTVYYDYEAMKDKVSELKLLHLQVDDISCGCYATLRLLVIPIKADVIYNAKCPVKWSRFGSRNHKRLFTPETYG
jgi:hypothetical protein